MLDFKNIEFIAPNACSLCVNKIKINKLKLPYHKGDIVCICEASIYHKAILNITLDAMHIPDLWSGCNHYNSEFDPFTANTMKATRAERAKHYARKAYWAKKKQMQAARCSDDKDL